MLQLSWPLRYTSLLAFLHSCREHAFGFPLPWYSSREHVFGFRRHYGYRVNTQSTFSSVRMTSFSLYFSYREHACSLAFVHTTISRIGVLACSLYYNIANKRFHRHSSVLQYREKAFLLDKLSFVLQLWRTSVFTGFPPTTISRLGVLACSLYYNIENKRFHWLSSNRRFYCLSSTLQHREQALWLSSKWQYREQAFSLAVLFATISRTSVFSSCSLW